MADLERLQTVLRSMTRLSTNCLLVGVLAVPLAGCGRSDPPEQDAQEITEEQIQAEIDAALARSARMKETMDQRIEELNQQKRGIARDFDGQLAEALREESRPAAPEPENADSRVDRPPTEIEMLQAVHRHHAESGKPEYSRPRGVRKVSCTRIAANTYRCVFFHRATGVSASDATRTADRLSQAERTAVFTFREGQWHMSLE